MKIFKMNECDFIAAENLEQAKQCLAESIDRGVVDAAFEEEYIDEPKELTERELNTFNFYDSRTEDHIISFKEQLDKEIAAGAKFPNHFASKEY